MGSKTKHSGRRYPLFSRKSHKPFGPFYKTVTNVIELRWIRRKWKYYQGGCGCCTRGPLPARRTIAGKVYLNLMQIWLSADEISFSTDVCAVILNHKSQCKKCQIQTLVMILFNTCSFIIMFQINPYGKGTCDCITSPPHVSLTVVDVYLKSETCENIFF